MATYHTPHAFQPSTRPGMKRFCHICGRDEGHSLHVQIFGGMETAVAEQEHAAALHQAAELAEEMKKPLGDINRKAGNMEENSPLFFGKVNPTLF